MLVQRQQVEARSYSATGPRPSRQQAGSSPYARRAQRGMKSGAPSPVDTRKRVPGEGWGEGPIFTSAEVAEWQTRQPQNLLRATL